jgi:snRNA-activating protein complex (SNAPc), subunit 3
MFLQGTLTEKREQVITLICNDNTRGWHTKRSHEVEVMPHHTLNDFIQVLPCPCIVAEPDPEGNDTDPTKSKKSKDNRIKEDITSYWCIDGTIYVKDPEEPCHLLVERAKAYVCAEVATGLRRLKKQGPPISIADDEHASAVPMGNMMTSTFGSLELPVGSKSYYHHDGGCVHELTVLDSRFVSPTDAVLREKPVVSFVQSGVRRKCDVCMLKTAEYKCFNDKISDAEGTIYCRMCYHGLQYTLEGKLKNDDLKAFTFL